MQIASMKNQQEWADKLRTILLRHVEEIAKIDKSGGISVLVWNPTDEWAKGLHKMKWDGTNPTVIRMPRWFRNNLKGTDFVTKRWIKRKNGPVRVFVINGPGTLLLNIGRGKEDGEGVGVYVEPGSTDHELGLNTEPVVILKDEGLWA